MQTYIVWPCLVGYNVVYLSFNLLLPTEIRCEIL
jgi:hypothetical protein